MNPHVFGTTDRELTDLLVERVMGWGIAPDRFMLGGRQWLSRWRFQPTEKIEDAFALLERVAPQRYTMSSDDTSLFQVRVQIDGVTGEASDTSKARALTYAIARALRVSVGKYEGDDPGGRHEP
jgi:hypothetical protein